MGMSAGLHVWACSYTASSDKWQCWLGWEWGRDKTNRLVLTDSMQAAGCRLILQRHGLAILRNFPLHTLTQPYAHYLFPHSPHRVCTFPPALPFSSSSVLQERKVCPPLRTIPEKRYSVYRWFYRCLRPHRGPGQDGMFIWLGWLQFLMNDNQSARAVASVISSVSEHLTFSLPFPAHGGSTRFGAATWVIHVDG
jgi:hypothetical protein